jgi:post-segregation antitoxin (ccd killing protein)
MADESTGAGVGTSIDELRLDILVNSNNASKRINAVTKSIENLNKALSKSGNLDKVLGKLNSVSPTTTTGGRTASGGTNRTLRNVGMFATLGKWNYMVNMARYYGRQLANIVQLSMDYVETQNLWQVANRENVALASEFVDKMNKAYGISEQTLMNYQAIFKNMLSALGDLSDMVSTTLSQQLTQLALDFSSLYNVTIANAMQKFQAVLSGQVRPIRSVSGYDITENTIYDIYKGMGGEKSMRQLSQLEKRLLRIYAVFDQMRATGASGGEQGDLAKTIESASNQARIMSEQFKEAMTWAGQMLLMWINSAGLFQKINAMLMTMKEIMKSLAFATGYMADDWSITALDGVEEVNDAVDELTGKLLSFDKFEALNKTDSGGLLGIDPKIEDLISRISVSMGNIEMEATKISNQWLKQIGLGQEMYRVLNANGDIIEYTAEQYAQLSEEEKKSFKNVENYRKMNDELKSTLEIIKSITISLGIIAVFAIINKIGTLIVSIGKLAFTMKSLNLVLTTGIIYAIVKAVEAFKEGDAWGGILATTIGIALVSAFVLLNKTMLITIGTKIAGWATTAMSAIKSFSITLPVASKMLYGLNNTLGFTQVALSGVIGLLGYLVMDNLFGSMGEDARRIVSPIMLAVSAITALSIALLAYKGILTWGVGLPIILGAVGVGIASFKAMVSPPAYATGGFPEDGLFFANSGEMVGKFSNGKTAVANNDQIVTGITQGVYNAMMAYNAQTQGKNGSGDVYLDGTKVGKVVAKSSHDEMVRTSLIKANA